MSPWHEDAREKAVGDFSMIELLLAAVVGLFVVIVTERTWERKKHV
jgi:Tfp pilus assembly protein PilW